MPRITWIQAERARVRSEAYATALDLLRRRPFAEAFERIEAKYNEHRDIAEAYAQQEPGK